MSFARINSIQKSPTRMQVTNSYSQLPYILNNPQLQPKSLTDLSNGLSPQKNIKFTKKMVRVVNGKFNAVPQDENYKQVKKNMSMIGLSQPKLNSKIVTEGAEPVTLVPVVQQSPTEKAPDSQQDLFFSNKKLGQSQSSASIFQTYFSKLTEKSENCEANKVRSGADIDVNVSLSDLQYQHLKGTCICSKCTCGKHECVVARNLHRKHPQQSVYSLSYIKKQLQHGENIDHHMYENMKSNTQTIDVDSVAHNDYRRPDQDNYINPTPSFKPKRVFELNPLQVGRSHYRRDFLEWGCVPYQPIKAYSNRTTMDEMPFTGATTYSKDFHKMKVTRPVMVNNNHTITVSKSVIPFFSSTTSQDFFRPFKAGERAVKYKATDELITGAPTFLGQFETLNQKDYRDRAAKKNNILRNSLNAVIEV